jgi:hypothetical protein
MHWGVEMARKGGVPPDRVSNAMPRANYCAIFSASGEPRDMRLSVRQ